jgi:nicotinamidase-related amidase
MRHSTLNGICHAVAAIGHERTPTYMKGENMETRTVSNMLRRSALVLGLIVLGAIFANGAKGQTIVDEWTSIKVPPAPELKPVKINAKDTALLVLDIVKQICGPRARCVASVPKIQRLLAQAREKGVLVVYSLAGQSLTDILPEVTPRAEEPSVSSGPDKFLNTNLDNILKEKGIKTVIVVGTSAEGAVLNTASGGAQRGLKVIIPVDGMSSNNPYAEQYTAWHLANAPRIGAQTTLTKFDLIGF